MKKLSEILFLSRTNRPDEWSMDDYTRQAEKLEGRIKELDEELTDLSKCFDGCYEELQATRDATDAYVSTLEHEVEWLDRQLTRYMLKYNKAVDNLQRENKR